MQTSFRPRRLVLLISALLACRAAPAREDLRLALIEADRAFAAATARDGAEGRVSFFSHDGAMIRPGAVVSGPDAIRAEMAGLFADPTFRLTWEPSHAEVSASGDLGYTVGRFVSVRSDPKGKPTKSTGT